MDRNGKIDRQIGRKTDRGSCIIPHWELIQDKEMLLSPKPIRGIEQVHQLVEEFGWDPSIIIEEAEEGQPIRINKHVECLE